jgi:hypothetical protein
VPATARNRSNALEVRLQRYEILLRQLKRIK